MINELDNIPNKSFGISYGKGFFDDKERNGLLGFAENLPATYYDDRIATAPYVQIGKGYSIYTDKGDPMNFTDTIVGLNLDQTTLVNPVPHRNSNLNNYNVDGITPVYGGEMNGGAFFTNILNLAKRLFNTGKQIIPHVKKGIEVGKKGYKTAKSIHDFTKNPSISNVTSLIKDIKQGVNHTKDLVNIGKDAYNIIKKPQIKPLEITDEYHDAETGEGIRKRRKKTGSKVSSHGKINNNDIKNLLMKINQVL